MKPDEQLDSITARLFETATEEVRRTVFAGHRDAVERVLREYPAISREPDRILDLIYAEVLAREDQSENPTSQDYARRFPALAERIERLFEVHEALSEDAQHADSDTGEAWPTCLDDAPPLENTDTHPRRTVGQYELLDELGSGATGIVFQAIQPGLGRPVAVKILRPFGSADARRRFRAEAELTARLQHPNIVKVYEVGHDSGCDFMSMELLCDGSLATVLGQTTFTPRGAAELSVELAGAVAAAHEQGIIHRDLKPGNVLMAPDRSPRISDFGLARHLSDLTTRQTRTGAILGTPGYMAPEQVDGSAEAGTTADIYSLGAILYELLTGRPPYHGTSVAEILAQMQVADPPPVQQLRPGVPRDLRTVCMKCLQRRPEDRYASAAELQNDLQRFLDGRPVTARAVTPLEHAWRWIDRHRGITALAVLAVALTLVGGTGVVWQWMRAEGGLASARTSATAASAARAAERNQRSLAETRLYRHQIQGADRELQFGALVMANRILNECDPEHRGWEWDFLNGRARSANVVISRPGLKFTSLDLSPDGTRIAATSGLNSSRANRRVTVWDVRSGEELWTHSANGIGMSVVFSPDGRYVGIGGHGTSTLHDAGTGELLKTFAVNTYSGGWGIAFSPDSRSVAISDSEVLRLFRTDPTNTSVQTCEQLKGCGGVHAISYQPGSRLIAAGTRRQGVTIIDSETAELIESLPMPGDVRCVEFSADGSLLVASGYSDIGQGCLRIWEATDDGFRQINNQYSQAGKVTRFRFSRDSQSVAVWTEGSRIRLVGPRDFRQFGTYTGHRPATHAAAFGPDSRVFATCGIDGRIHIWDRTPESRRHLRRHDNAHATDCAIDPTGRFVAVTGDRNPSRGYRSYSNCLDIMDLERWTCVRSLRGHTKAVSCVDWNGTGDCLASGSDDHTVRLWVGDGVECRGVLSTHAAPIAGVHFLSDDSGEPPDARLVSVDRSGVVIVHDWRQSSVVSRFETPFRRITHTAASATKAAIATPDGDAGIVDLTTGTVTRVRASSAVHSVAFNPAGDRLCAGAEDGRVVVWKSEDPSADPEWTTTLEGPIQSVSYHPDGRRIVACGSEGCATILDAETGSQLLNVWQSGQSGAIARAMFDRAGRRLVATSRQRLYAWDRDPVEVVMPNVSPGAIPDQEMIADWHRSRARSCDETNNAFGAALHWTKVAQLTDDAHDAHTRAAESWEQLKEFERAEHHFRSAVEIAVAHEDERDWDNTRGETQHRLARFLATCPDVSFRRGPEALALVRRSLVISPRRADYWSTLTLAMKQSREAAAAESSR